MYVMYIYIYIEILNKYKVVHIHHKDCFSPNALGILEHMD